MKCCGTTTNNLATATFPNASSTVLYIVRKEGANPIVSKSWTVSNITLCAMLYVNKSGNENNAF